MDQTELATIFQNSLDSSGDRDVVGTSHFPERTAPRTKFMREIVARADEMYNTLKEDSRWTEKNISGPVSTPEILLHNC
jgi:hypothetical protein